MIFPFTAIVGQEEMKTGLIINVIDPSIGGLLIMGEKGTAKSTAVRALAELLPETTAVKGCPFNCDPDGVLCTACLTTLETEEHLHRAKKKMRMVELPLGITEDRLVGTLDIEHALKKGEKRFEPGLLADANRNFLYVDEVNLLEDHIVDLLLDSAAMGVNTVEREGISFSHPARFILVGTMNPEEGELRPQLLDRFGLCVDVEGIRDVRQRVEIVERREAFEDDAEAFASTWEPEEHAEAERIRKAILSLGDVAVDREILVAIAHLGIELEVDGHRADLVTRKAAQAVAAHEGRDRVTLDDVEGVAPMVLAHRVKPTAGSRRGLADIGEILRSPGDGSKGRGR